MAVYASDYNEFPSGSNALFWLMGASLIVPLLLLIGMAIDGILLIPALGLTAAVIGTEALVGTGLVITNDLTPSFFMHVMLSSTAAASLLLIVVGSLGLAGIPFFGAVGAAASLAVTDGIIGVSTSLYGLFKMSEPFTKLEEELNTLKELESLDNQDPVLV